MPITAVVVYCRYCTGVFSCTELLNVCLVTTICDELIDLYVPVHILPYQGKCKSSYGHSFPVDFP